MPVRYNITIDTLVSISHKDESGKVRWERIDSSAPLCCFTPDAKRKRASKKSRRVGGQEGRLTLNRSIHSVEFENYIAYNGGL